MWPCVEKARSDDARGVVTLTLQRPEAFNSLSEAMLAELQAHLDALKADDSVRVVVLHRHLVRLRQGTRELGRQVLGVDRPRDDDPRPLLRQPLGHQEGLDEGRGSLVHGGVRDVEAGRPVPSPDCLLSLALVLICTLQITVSLAYQQLCFATMMQQHT
jgi:hypothetical protein